MTITQAKQKVLQNAIKALQKETGLTVACEKLPEQGGYDFNTLLRIAMQNMTWEFAAEVILVLNRAVIGVVAQQIRNLPYRGLLIARYVTPQLADLLKELNIPFIDMAGNAYLNEPPLYIFIKGHRIVDNKHRGPQIRAFRPAGLQIIFALLTNPGLEDAPFREIAKFARVALGTVGFVMKDLKELGYLIDMGPKGRRLRQKEKLLTRWVTNYPEQLRPKQLMGRFKAFEDDWWKHTDLQKYQALWGGETAAAYITKFLKPEVITIYTQQLPNRLIIQNRLRKDPTGNVEILKTFWEFNLNNPYRNIVHPILIYADLLATADARNAETANLIYEKEITQFVRED